MTAYYLIPTKWLGEGGAEASFPNNTDWIRLVQCSHQKKQREAEKYEQELNDGVLFDMEIVVRDNKTLYSVLPLPYNQARDYTNFNRWPCNRDENNPSPNEILAKVFAKGWKHFLDCIDFGSSNLDAEAIQFMNEVPGKVIKALKES